MFSLHDFVMKTLKSMEGKLPEYQVREYALNWYNKGVLTDDDLAQVESWYAEEAATEDSDAE